MLKEYLHSIDSFKKTIQLFLSAEEIKERGKVKVKISRQSHQAATSMGTWAAAQTHLSHRARSSETWTTGPVPTAASAGLCGVGLAGVSGPGTHLRVDAGQGLWLLPDPTLSKMI